MISIIIISFNTRDLLRRCLHTAIKEAEHLDCEIIVIDNDSRDNSIEMVRRVFPCVRLVRKSENLGFAGGNNVGFGMANGEFIVLLNSDAFLKSGALKKALEKMEEYPQAGIGGAKLSAENGFVQPAARMFPSMLNEFLQLSGLADKFPRNRFIGRADRTWVDSKIEAECDWVPGAFTIIRKKVFDSIGYFDKDFFLYFEEVDFCHRAKKNGWQVWYWPTIEVEHIGGCSSRTIKQLNISKSGSQLELWRMRSQLLYHRKNNGIFTTNFSFWMEYLWHKGREWKNRKRNPEKSRESGRITGLLTQAWRDTRGGLTSPPRPW